MSEVSGDDLSKLLTYFSKSMYKATDTNPVCQEALYRCVELANLDYSCLLVANHSGELSAHYPAELIVMENELQNNNLNVPGRTTGTIYESTYDKSVLRDMIYKARTARCRARFPIPVILYKGKYVCRSATLAGGPELYTRTGIDYFFNSCEPPGEVPEEYPEGSSLQGAEPEDVSQTTDQGLFDNVRRSDINYLKMLNVMTIVDFMVEKKKVKFGLYVTSSEKVDREHRYQDFTIVSLPYPGCEFFREYRNHDYTAKGLIFNWDQSYVDADIVVPSDIASQVKIDWSNYKKWDLVMITQNYLKVVIRYLQEGNSGILMHCISGWDRTPLFISLLRMSLWADGIVHQQLTTMQMLYFTIAYDWMLFGHNLPNRLDKGEEIFHFCFHMLKFIEDEEFSVLPSRRTKHNSSGSSSSIVALSQGGTSSCSSISVLSTTSKNDGDCQIEALQHEDSCGSNISLNSVCSSTSLKDNEMPPIWFRSEQDESSNGNITQMLPNSLEASPPPAQRTSPYSPRQQRTSPIMVPSRVRQRNDSPSSVASIGSWQMISDTGSLHSSNSTTDSTATISRIDQSGGSSCTVIDDDFGGQYSSFRDPLHLRKTRLTAVRQMFGMHYSQSVGLKLKTTHDTSLGSLLGNIAEKVGLTSKPSV